MYTKIATRIEMFFLDFFIYVLSESKIFRFMVNVSVALLIDKIFLLKFSFICLIFSFIGMGLGLYISIITEKLF